MAFISFMSLASTKSSPHDANPAVCAAQGAVTRAAFFRGGLAALALAATTVVVRPVQAGMLDSIKNSIPDMPAMPVPSLPSLSGTAGDPLEEAKKSDGAMSSEDESQADAMMQRMIERRRAAAQK